MSSFLRARIEQGKQKERDRRAKEEPKEERNGYDNYKLEQAKKQAEEMKKKMI